MQFKVFNPSASDSVRRNKEGIGSFFPKQAHARPEVAPATHCCLLLLHDLQSILPLRAKPAAPACTSTPAARRCRRKPVIGPGGSLGCQALHLIRTTTDITSIRGHPGLPLQGAHATDPAPGEAQPCIVFQPTPTTVRHGCNRPCTPRSDCRRNAVVLLPSMYQRQRHFA